MNRMMWLNVKNFILKWNVANVCLVGILNEIWIQEKLFYLFCLWILFVRIWCLCADIEFCVCNVITLAKVNDKQHPNVYAYTRQNSGSDMKWCRSALSQSMYILFYLTLFSLPFIFGPVLAHFFSRHHHNRQISLKNLVQWLQVMLLVIVYLCTLS